MKATVSAGANEVCDNTETTRLLRFSVEILACTFHFKSSDVVIMFVLQIVLPLRRTCYLCAQTRCLYEDISTKVMRCIMTHVPVPLLPDMNWHTNTKQLLVSKMERAKYINFSESIIVSLKSAGFAPIKELNNCITN